MLIIVGVTLIIVGLVLGALVIIGGSNRRSANDARIKRQHEDEKRRMERERKAYQNNLPRFKRRMNSSICKNCGRPTNSAGADCSVCQSLLKGR